MSEKITSIRGMRTIFGDEATQYEQLLTVIREVLHLYAYQPIHLPLLEKTALFKRAVGEETDVVNKEMYTFNDRNDESITLRPEATAGVVRAIIENGLWQQTQRLYTEGAMFRYERPQKGRYRQFTQVSVEAFGSNAPALDAELIDLGDQLFKRLGFRDKVTLEINTIGLAEERKIFQESLVRFLTLHMDKLDEDSQRRLTTNPMRILDSKDPQTQQILDDAPVLDDFLGAESKAHFAAVCELLNALNIPFKRNARLVRGLDYYNHTVFEWTTNELGAQGTITAGGRYDGLVEQLGGKATPAAGFAFGIDRILLLAQQTGFFTTQRPMVYAITTNSHFYPALFSMCQQLRTNEIVVMTQCDPQSLKQQIKKADKSGAKFALIIGDEEFSQQKYSIKNLRDGSQKILTASEVLTFIKENL